MRPARTRFAPSPTGYMHVGGVRTALFAWLVATQTKGQFILRIEDTDKVREVEGSEQHIIDSLRWLGIMWDEGPDKGGDCGPYRQSERLDSYNQWAQKLVESGRAYADPTTPEELEEFRQQAIDQKKPFLFREHRPENPPKWQEGLPLRFKSEPKKYDWRDEVLGDLSTGEEAIDDFIILKSDGFPTYNFAHIIDDHLMEITHVIRSQEFLASVPRFLNLYEALGLEVPTLATLPYVMGPDGRKKLSKRDGAKDILDYKKQGFLPEALVNFMASLGWNDGTEQEIFSVEELTQKFSLERVHRGGARFDEQRLIWMNGHYIRALQQEELYKKVGVFWPQAADSATDSYKRAVLGLVQERLKFFAELPELTDFFFTEPSLEQVLSLYANPVDKQLVRLENKNMEYKRLLEASVEELALTGFEQDEVQEKLNKLLRKLDTKPAVLFPVLRIAVTGKQVSPELFSTLSVLGKEKTLGRIKKAIYSLEK